MKLQSMCRLGIGLCFNPNSGFELKLELKRCRAATQANETSAYGSAIQDTGSDTIALASASPPESPAPLEHASKTVSYD